METRKRTTHSMIMEDLAHLLETIPNLSEAKSTIQCYMSSMPKDCPTSDCHHHPTDEVYVCTGYSTRHHLYSLRNDRLDVNTRASHPLVLGAFCQLQMRGNCKNCKAADYFYRRPTHGKVVFCHNCGFFIDFERRTAGYTEDFLIPSIGEKFY